MRKLSQARPELMPEQVKEPFNMDKAIQYNSKSKNVFAQWSDDIHRILGTSADWSSPEFAQAVYDWQQKNGLVGKLTDAMLGPITLQKMAEVDSELGAKYKPRALYGAGKSTQPTKKILALKDKFIAASEKSGIPTWLLAGWSDVESAGHWDDITLSKQQGKEVGLFQVSQKEADRLGIDIDSITQSEDASIDAGIKLIKMREGDANKVLSAFPSLQNAFTQGSDLYWHLVMFCFSAGEGTAHEVLALMAKNNFVPKNWDDFTTFVETHARELHRGLYATKWAVHVARAEQVGQNAVNSGAAMAHKKNIRIKNAKLKARKIALEDSRIIE